MSNVYANAPHGGEILAVVFDVGKVLVQWDMRLLFKKLIDDPKRLDWIMDHVITEAWHFEHDAGRDLNEMVVARKIEFPGHDNLIDAYATRFLETIPDYVPGSVDIVRELSAASVPLFAITNFASSFWKSFRASDPLFDMFGDIVVSGDEKIAKPDARIFNIAEKRFGFNPPEMLFVDDNEANIAAAQKLGWQVHHFKNALELREDLVRYRLL